jgi:hypothetical protein
VSALDCIQRNFRAPRSIEGLQLEMDKTTSGLQHPVHPASSASAANDVLSVMGSLVGSYCLPRSGCRDSESGPRSFLSIYYVKVSVF